MSDRTTATVAALYVEKNGAYFGLPDVDLVERVSPAPRLEMFSRRARLGWDTWGDEALHGTEAVA